MEQLNPVNNAIEQGLINELDRISKIEGVETITIIIITITITGEPFKVKAINSEESEVQLIIYLSLINYLLK